MSPKRAAAHAGAEEIAEEDPVEITPEPAPAPVAPYAFATNNKSFGLVEHQQRLFSRALVLYSKATHVVSYAMHALIVGKSITEKAVRRSVVT